MNHFWAEFENLNKDVFRFDTRIYLNPIEEINSDDICVGAIVGKNPGSAKPVSISEGMKPIELSGDKLLPTVRNIVLKTYKKVACNPTNRGYIQVLNLFYLCNPNLGEAIKSLKSNESAKNCPAETKEFPWVWYVWGGESPALNIFKKRVFA